MAQFTFDVEDIRDAQKVGTHAPHKKFAEDAISHKWDVTVTQRGRNLGNPKTVQELDDILKAAGVE